ncbi:MAG TPA: magnesium chelatase domain-containing protein [Candidatus Hydrogenedentes bacterium]|nr:magnesium chelatase domain-containing protein [Candidatus Hydrogenedentota bacterium]
MLARVNSCAVLGIDAFPLSVEVDNVPGSNTIRMVGLPDAAVKESQDRVFTAMRNSGFYFPRGHVVISLAPGDMRKEGSAFDLPIAIATLGATRQLSSMRISDYALVGELALDGSIRPVPGALAMAICAKASHLRGLILPWQNAEEAGVVQGLEVIGANTLNEVVAFLKGEVDIPAQRTNVASLFTKARVNVPDFSEVKGQAHVKRALTVAAAGGHNILMVWRQCQIWHSGHNIFMLWPQCQPSNRGLQLERKQYPSRKSFVRRRIDHGRLFTKIATLF